jgi:hypothetical protein
MSNQESAVATRHVVVTSTKSVGIQILLIFFFGPLGLFYSTIIGALTLLLGVPIVFAILAALTGLGAARVGTDNAAAAGLLALGGEIFLMIGVWWIGSFVWGIPAVQNYNKKLLQRVTV